MSRFFVPKENITDKKAVLAGDEYKHVISVMRMTVGDKVVFFDGTGNEYSGKIVNIGAKTAEIEIVETKKCVTGDNMRIVLAQALPKKDKMDYILEKATELGVSAVVPVLTDRTIVKLDQGSTKTKADRWKKIAIEASKQCGRLIIPEIYDVMKFDQALSFAMGFDLILFAWLAEGTLPLRTAVEGFKGKSVIIFIGPEGDFTPDEADGARKLGAKFVSLGSNVLKSDTAGLFTISCLNYEFQK